MGDKCDPVPCPGSSAEMNYTFVKSGEVQSKGMRWQVTEYEGRLSHITVKTLGSHSTTGAFAKVTPEWTEYRYCVDGTGPAHCTDSALINNYLLRQRPTRSLERYDDPWHRVWVDPLKRPKDQFFPTGDDNPVETGVVYDDTTELIRQWHWQEDFAYWAGKFPTVASYAIPTEPGDGGGTFWAHVETMVGMTSADQNPHNTGMHPRADNATTPADMLSNNVQPLAPISSRWDFEILGGVQYVAHDRLRITVDPRDRPCINCGGLAWYPSETQQIVVLPNAGFGVLQQDGSVAMLDGAVGPTLAETLQFDLVWANAVESNPLSGRGAAGPAAVALSPDATTVVEHAFVQGNRVVGAADLYATPNYRTLGYSPNVGDSADLPPRAVFQTVYSRSAGKLFVVGGQSPTTGEPTRDVWWRDIEVGSWMRVPLRGWQPENVLAATRCPRDGRLWVLDETKTQQSRMARLVRVDPSTGEVDQLGTWLRVGMFDHHWLVLDNEGNVLLVSSSSSSRSHTVVSFWVDGSAEPIANLVRSGHRELAMSPWVDAAGYAFPVVVNKNELPQVVRLDNLEGRVAQWSDVGNCVK